MSFRLRSWAIQLGIMLLSIASTASAQGGGGAGRNMFIAPNRPLLLLQPLGGPQQLPAQPGLGMFFLYFNTAWPWVIGVAGGIAVLQALVGGIQIMMSGSGEKAEEGKTRLMWALGGMLLVAFSGFILRLLNNLFFV